MNLDECFAILERCAVNGERCPVNAPTGAFPNRLTTELAKQGKIRIEVMCLNWRIVTILIGPHAGKHTAEPPEGRKTPYLIVDRDGARYHGKAIERRTAAPVTLRRFSWDSPT